MSEIYWLTRIGTISDACGFLFFICTIVVAATVILYVVGRMPGAEYDDGPFQTLLRKAVRDWRLYAVTAVFGLGVLFIPSKQELLAIYGIGSVIDYVQDSDKAKQLPDKAVEALIKYLEEAKDEKDG